MKKLRTQLEHAQRGGSMDLVKEIESKINQFCRYNEYKIKFEHEEVYALNLLQSKRDQTFAEDDQNKKRYFKNYVRNEEMKEIGTQTD